MTPEEKEKFFGKKKRFTPLFETPSVEKKPKKKHKNKVTEDKVDTKVDKVSRKKDKPTKKVDKVDKVDKVSKPKQKKNKKERNMDKGLDKVSMQKKKRSKKPETLTHSEVKERASKVGMVKYKTIEGDAANDMLITLYSKVTQKKTKKEKDFDEAMGRSMTSTGILIALHEDAGSERFNMMGKLVEKKFAVAKGYATDHHLYEIFK